MRKGPAIAIGLLVLIVVAFGAFVLLQGAPSGAAPSVSATESAEPTEAPLDEGLLAERLTVLVIGTDRNAERADSGEPENTDAILLASISADQSELALVSLPRDTVDIPLSDGSTWDEKVNAILRERDVETLVGAMETLFDVPIDGHVVIDMEDFAALVEAAGGIDVAPEQALVDPGIDFSIEPGAQRLDATEALKYVRSRQDGDYNRAARQQEVLLALVAELTDPQTDVDLRQLLDGLGSLETDLPLDDLPTLLEIARRAQTADVTREVLQPPRFIAFEGDRGDGRGYILEPDIDAMQSLVQELMGE